MNIDVSHRGKLERYKKEDYYELAESCVNKIRNLSNVESIILCGSLAKGDIIPGWSDVDIIVILKDRVGGTKDLINTKEALSAVSSNYNIGIGLDIVYKEEFVRTRKFNGRPLAMTFEVSKYGITKYGKDFLKDIEYNDYYKNLVDIERKSLLASEIHSWRRNFVFKKDELGSLRFLFYTCKSLLRILQIETGPNFSKPINCFNSLQKYKSLNKPEECILIMENAVEIRKNWFVYFERSKEEIEELSMLLSHKLNLYPYL